MIFVPFDEFRISSNCCHVVQHHHEIFIYIINHTEGEVIQHHVNQVIVLSAVIQQLVQQIPIMAVEEWWQEIKKLKKGSHEYNSWEDNEKASSSLIIEVKFCVNNLVNLCPNIGTWESMRKKILWKLMRTVKK